MSDVEAQVVEALALWGGSGLPRLITNRENAVFEVSLASGRAALRLHRAGYQTEAAVRSELWWQMALAGGGLAVPLPLATQAGDLVARLEGRGADQGLINADVLRENVLERGGALTLIDFDDSGFGYRLYDLGTALSQSLTEPHLAAIAAALIDGYASLRPLTEADRAMVPVFTLLRTLASVGWTMPRMAFDDPSARAHIDRAVRAARIVMGGGELLASPEGDAI